MIINIIYVYDVGKINISLNKLCYRNLYINIIIIIMYLSLYNF